LFSVFSKQQRSQPGLLGLIGPLGLVLCLMIGMAGPGLAATDNVCLESGPGKIEVNFIGNAAYSARELRKAATREMVGLARGEIHCPEIDDAAFQMEDFYRTEGFAMATVGYEVKPVPDGTMVLFRVEEGLRVRIDGINFAGASFFPTEELLAMFADQRPGLLSAAKPVFVERQVRAAVDRIRELYHAQGFLDLTLTGPLLEYAADRTLVTVSVKIDEGRRSKVGPIIFSGEMVEEAAAPLAVFADTLHGQPYTPWKNVELRSRIVEEFGRFGYPEPQVDVETQDGETSGEMRLMAHIRRGPRVRISRLELTGNTKTTPSFIENRLALRPGDWYSVEKKRQSFENLYKTGLYSRLELNLAPREGDEGRALAVHLEELPSREVSMEAGWGAYELLRGRLGVSENNLFGSGRQLKAEAGASLKGEDVILQFSDPWFLGSDLRFSLPLSHSRREEPSFVKREDGIAVQFSKEIVKKLTTIASYDYKQTKVTAIDGMEAMVDPNATDYATGALHFQGTIDTRNDLFFPSRGGKFFLAEELASQALGGEVDYSRSTAGIRWFFPLRPATVLGLRYDTGFILPMGAQATIPLGERFFNGGENSVRSFTQDRLGPRDISGDPLGGTAYNVLSMEVRQRLSRSFSLSLFVDLGNISPDSPLDGSGEQQYDSRSALVNATFNDYFNGFRTGVGLGLQYLLPVGPVRLDVACNPDRQAERGEKDMMVNFSVGMAF